MVSINIPSFYDLPHSLCARGFFAMDCNRQPNEEELKKNIVSVLRTYGLYGTERMLPDFARYLFVGTGV